MTRDAARWRLACAYGAASALVVAIAVGTGGWALLLSWPAISLALVALAYGAVGPEVFQKGKTGVVAAGLRFLLWPYTIGARVNAWAWLRGRNRSDLVLPGLRIGAIAAATSSAVQSSVRVIDLCAEIQMNRAVDPAAFIPMLDLVPATPAELSAAADAIQVEYRAAGAQGGEILVCCALGYSRSAAAVVTWMVAYGKMPTIDEAIALVRSRRPGVVLGDAHVAAISRAVRDMEMTSIDRKGAGADRAAPAEGLDYRLRYSSSYLSSTSGSGKSSCRVFTMP